MRSWPAPYLPPTLTGIEHPPLQLRDSYTGKIGALGSSNSIYVCGITPYDATHLGHAATYLTFDLIHRYLSASGQRFDFAENITDIDDPLFERAHRDGVSWQELATSQIDLFVSDMTELRVIPPRSYRGVIESMDQIIETVKSLVTKNLTYQIDGDLYLDLTLIPGALENLPIPIHEALEIFKQRGGDPDRDGKRHPLDPLLWKGQVPDEPSWPAPFGAGRPGWHIECVAIALNNLGDAGQSSITVQGGGVDLRFPHHYMTAVQASAITGKPFSSLYIHCGMIGLNGEKMSKSKGNLVFVSTLVNEGISPVAIRAALISRHYRDEMMWSSAILTSTEEFLARLQSCLARMEVAPTSTLIAQIVAALSNDLDTPKVFELLQRWCSETENGSTGGEAGELARALDLYLGLTL